MYVWVWVAYPDSNQMQLFRRFSNRAHLESDRHFIEFEHFLAVYIFVVVLQARINSIYFVISDASNWHIRWDANAAMLFKRVNIANIFESGSRVHKSPHSIEEEKCNKFILVAHEHSFTRHSRMQFSHSYVKTTIKFHIHLQHIKHSYTHLLLAKINAV